MTSHLRSCILEIEDVWASAYFHQERGRNINEKDLINEQDEDDVIVITDEDGVESEFEFLDLIEHEGKEYVVLYPLADGGKGNEVIILQVEVTDETDEDGDEIDSFVGIEDEDVLDAVFKIFQSKFADFVEEEES